MPKNGKLLTIREAAKLTELSPWQIRHFVRNGQLAGIMTGKDSKRCRYVTRESLEKLLKGGAK